MRADQVTAQLDPLPQFTFIRQGMLIAVDLAIATDIFGDMDAVVINLGPERPPRLDDSSVPGSAISILRTQLGRLPGLAVGPIRRSVTPEHATT